MVFKISALYHSHDEKMKKLASDKYIWVKLNLDLLSSSFQVLFFTDKE